MKGFFQGYFAIGLIAGMALATLGYLAATDCTLPTTTLWFCGEEDWAVIAALELVAKLVASLAWPIAALLVAVIYRSEIRKLVSLLRVSKLKFGNFEAEFAESLDDVQAELRSDPDLKVEKHAPSPEILGLMQVDQKYAVLVAWARIEEKLRDLAKHTFPYDYERHGRAIPMFRIINDLELPRAMQNALTELLRARNQIAHSSEPDMSDQEILRFLDIASDIEAYLGSRRDKIDF